MGKFSRILASATVASVLATVPALAEDLTIGLASEPTAMDPHYHNLGPNNAMARHVYDNLILQNEKQQLQPGLAVSWKALDDLTWEFKLREGVKFHDGNPLTADDVVFSFERAPNVPNSPSSYATYTKGKTVVKVDDLTVHIKTEKPYPLMANDVSTIPIVSSRPARARPPRTIIPARPRSVPAPSSSSSTCPATASSSSATPTTGARPLSGTR